MAVEIITKEDLNQFRIDLLKDISELFNRETKPTAQWLKSKDVRKLLNISSGTLQQLRINRKLVFVKIGGTFYYKQSAIEELLNNDE